MSQRVSAAQKRGRNLLDYLRRRDDPSTDRDLIPRVDGDRGRLSDPPAILIVSRGQSLGMFSITNPEHRELRVLSQDSRGNILVRCGQARWLINVHGERQVI